MSPTGADACEWTRFFPSNGWSRPEVLHARFIRHAFSRHTHDEYVVGLIESGVQRFDLGRTTHYTPAGSIFLINPGEAHTGGSGVQDGYVYRTFYPSEDLIRAAAVEFGAVSVTSPSFGKAVIADQDLFGVLLAYHQSVADEASSLEQETRLHHVISLLLVRHTQPGAPDRRLARATRAVHWAREYLDAGYMRNVSLSELAKACGSSPFHLARSFTAEFGLPPHAYLDGLRVAHAKRMILAGTSLAEAAYSVGLCDQSHLNRRFKRIVGVTPGQYVQQSNSPKRAFDLPAD
jgi:AraC-like DNA-binding protein